MLRRDSPTPREHMSERLWMRDRMALLHSVCHHHEFVKTSHRGSHETCSPQVLTEPSHQPFPAYAKHPTPVRGELFLGHFCSPEFRGTGQMVNSSSSPSQPGRLDGGTASSGFCQSPVNAGLTGAFRMFRRGAGCRLGAGLRSEDRPGTSSYQNVSRSPGKAVDSSGRRAPVLGRSAPAADKSTLNRQETIMHESGEYRVTIDHGLSADSKRAGLI